MNVFSSRARTSNIFKRIIIRKLKLVMILDIQAVQRIESTMLREIDALCNRKGVPYYLCYGSALGAVRHSGAIPWDADVDIGIPYPHYKMFFEMVKEALPQYILYNYPEGNLVCLFSRLGLKGCKHEDIHVDIYPIIGFPDGRERQLAENDYLQRLIDSFHWKARHAVNDKRFLYRMAKILIRELKALFVFRSKKRIYSEFVALCEKYPYETAETVRTVARVYKEKNIMPKRYFGPGIRHPYADFTATIPEQYDEYLKALYKNYHEFPSEEVRRRGLEIKVEMRSDC